MWLHLHEDVLDEFKTLGTLELKGLSQRHLAWLRTKVDVVDIQEQLALLEAQARRRKRFEAFEKERRKKRRWDRTKRQGAKRRARTQEKIQETRFCVWCGKKLVLKPLGLKKRYCNVACRQHPKKVT